MPTCFFRTTLMDIRQYFDPVDFSGYQAKIKDAWRYSLGQDIEKSTGKLTLANINKLEIAVFSVPFYNGSWEKAKNSSTSRIREELYKLAAINKKMNVADFGQLKKTQSPKGILLALRDIVEYFTDLGVVSIVIGGSQDLTTGICKAFYNNPCFSLTSVDSALNIKKGRETFSPTNFLSRVFQNNPQIFQFSLVGYQGHLVPDGLLSKTKGIGAHIRLGVLRECLLKAEPVFRNTDVLSFDIGVLKYSEIPGSTYKNPNGLYSEEACQMAKFAGLSNRLKVFGIFEALGGKGDCEIVFKISAEIIWYFLEGYVNRTQKEKELPENLLTYKVEIKEIDEPLVFYHCAGTGRWWFDAGFFKGEKLMVACSEDEYKEASNNEIPEIWLKYIQKIDESSK